MCGKVQKENSKVFVNRTDIESAAHSSQDRTFGLSLNWVDWLKKKKINILHLIIRKPKSIKYDSHNFQDRVQKYLAYK